MIPDNITSNAVLAALREIDENGVPSKRSSRKYILLYNDRPYPPKYVISIANKIANGVELKHDEFNGGKESNDFLSSLGFEIKRK